MYNCMGADRVRLVWGGQYHGLRMMMEKVKKLDRRK